MAVPTYAQTANTTGGKIFDIATDGSNYSILILECDSASAANLLYAFDSATFGRLKPGQQLQVGAGSKYMPRVIFVKADAGTVTYNLHAVC